MKQKQDVQQKAREIEMRAREMANKTAQLQKSQNNMFTPSKESELLIDIKKNPKEIILFFQLLLIEFLSVHAPKYSTFEH